MSRTSIDVYIRSFEPVEVDTDIYDYTYKKVSRVIATVENKSFSMGFGDSTNASPNISVVLRFIFANTNDDRINRITHIKYLNTIYNVESIQNYPPRVRVTLGGVFKDDEDSLRLEVSKP